MQPSANINARKNVSSDADHSRGALQNLFHQLCDVILVGRGFCHSLRQFLHGVISLLQDEQSVWVVGSACGGISLVFVRIGDSIGGAVLLQ